MSEFYLKIPKFAPRLKCDGCRVRDGHMHKCHGIVRMDDFLVRVIEINTSVTDKGLGKDGIIYEGMASELSSTILDAVCWCETCNSFVTNQG